jgi:O-acetyl-ADP-ribose deacetylase (regulator of RNase III)
MEILVGNHVLRLTRGDITAAVVDAIVNAANGALVGGGGVDGAIHRAGGPAIMRDCRRIGECPTGDAVATTAGQLAAKHVIHAVAPIWRGGSEGEPDLLRSAYLRSLQVAADLGDRTIAFPSLGTGAYGYPMDQAARAAVTTVAEFLRGDARIVSATFFLYSDDAFAVFNRALLSLPDADRKLDNSAVD